VNKTAGRIAYEAYGNVTGHKNFQGSDMPSWDDLPAIIREAWETAAEAVIDAGFTRE
jgi:hypothetical protein